MSSVHLRGVDLNLLVALDALLAEGHVTRAAARVGVTQSAMSHSLGRLRELFADPLFVRTPHRMLPTPRGAELALPVRRILEDIGRALAPEAPFDPKTVERDLTVATVDYGELVLLSSLWAYLTVHAPRATVLVRPVPQDAEAALESGAVDIVVGPKPEASPRVFVQRLFDERFVCVVRKDHPEVKRKLTLERFVRLSHLQIAVRGTRGGPVDDALAALGIERRVALRVPHFLVAPLLVAKSDLVVTLPERLARTFEPSFGLRIVEPPLEVPEFTIWQAWHERNNQDAAHTFFRGAIAAAAKKGN